MSRRLSLTPSIEDYLETIYRQSDLGKIGVRSTDVAAQLQVAKPSVNRALRNLIEGGLITQAPYALIYLTEEGKAQAAGIFNRHRTLQLFLRDVLGVKEPVAEEDACKMEHIISEQTMAALTQFMSTYFTP
jgi:DtxR family Mn-dependent transcriptional regulator